VALYDAYLYDSFPVAESHPDRLAGVAALFGVHPAPVSRARVLELGCGLGGNLIPHAVAYPGSEFLGVDQSSRQIAIAQADVDAMGLTNIRFRAADILELGDEIGRFDYVICHGVYSWVPDAVQAKILRICGERLNPGGVAFISYNTLPGWHMRGMLREILRREVDPSGTPEEHIARAREFLKFFERLPGDEGSLAQRWFRSEVELLGKLSDKYLYYEHLIERNDPKYFRDFAAEAERAGLTYLGDAHFWTMVTERLGPEAVAWIGSRTTSIVDTEQYMDLLDPRLFRRSLLVRAGTEIDRDVSWVRLPDVWVQGHVTPASTEPSLEPGVDETFTTTGGATLTVGAPLMKAALVLLARSSPRGRRFRDLVSESRALVDGVAPVEPTPADGEAIGASLLGVHAQGYLELGVAEPPYVAAASERPTTTALVRLQTGRDQRDCTNLRHESVLADTFDRTVLHHADGTRTRAELLDVVVDAIAAGLLVVEVNDVPTTDRETLRAVLDHKLEALARQALFLA
jgi:SAM-dependent methyltransferase